MEAYGINWRGKPVGLFACTGWDTQMPGRSKLTGVFRPVDNADGRRMSERLGVGGHVEVSLDGLGDSVEAWLSIDERLEARLYVRRRVAEASRPEPTTNFVAR